MRFVSSDMTSTRGGQTSTQSTQPLQVSMSIVTVAGWRGTAPSRNTGVPEGQRLDGVSSAPRGDATRRNDVLRAARDAGGVRVDQLPAVRPQHLAERGGTQRDGDEPGRRGERAERDHA